jgi:hypothetical protein
MTTTGNSDRRKIVLAVFLLLAAAVVTWLVVRPETTPFHAIAYPCLPMDTATTDPGQFVMVSGHREPPLEHTLPDGRVVYAVFSCADPQVVPLVGGKRLYFPVRFFNDDDIETPPLPPRGQPLQKRDRGAITRYVPDEAMQQLKTALQGTAP